MSSAVELHPVLTTGGLEERLFALQQLQDVMLRSQNVGDLEVAAGSLTQCFADFSSLEGPWSAMELETFYALLRCSNALCDAEGQGGFAYLFARPSCLMPIREALASAYDFEMHDEAVKLCAAVAVKFPLSVLRSMIPHDLLKAEVWPSLPLRARHVTLGVLYSAASIIQTREDAAMLLMLVPTLKDIVAAPPLPTPAVRSNSRGGRSATDDAAHSLHLSTPPRASVCHASSAGGSARGGGSSSSGRIDTPHEAFTRELALRAVVRLLLISVGLCRFPIAVPPPPPLQVRQALPAGRGGGADAPSSALVAEAGGSSVAAAGVDGISVSALAAAGDGSADTASACAAIDRPMDAAEPSAAAGASGIISTGSSCSTALVATREPGPTTGDSGVMPRTARTASSEADDSGVGGLFDALVASSGGSGGGIGALLDGGGSAEQDAAASAIAAALAAEAELLQLQQDAYDDEEGGDGGDGDGEGEEEEEDEEGRGSGRALHAGAMRARRPGQRSHAASSAPHAHGAPAGARRPQREPVSLQRPAWPRLSVLHMLRSCRMLRFLVRVLSAATRVQTPPAGARGALASTSALAAGGTADAAAVGASSGGRAGVVVFPLTLYALRCVVRVLVRTLAFCRAEAAAAQPSAAEAPSRARGVPAVAAAVAAATAAAAVAAGTPPSVPAGVSVPLAAERGTVAAAATDVAAATAAAATGAAAAPPPALSRAEAAELRACCLRIIAGAPLGRYSNPQEREEALELCDDAGVLLLDLQAHERQTAQQAAERQARPARAVERPGAAAAVAPPGAAHTDAAAVTAAAAPSSIAAALRMPRR